MCICVYVYVCVYVYMCICVYNVYIHTCKFGDFRLKWQFLGMQEESPKPGPSSAVKGSWISANIMCNRACHF